MDPTEQERLLSSVKTLLGDSDEKLIENDDSFNSFIEGISPVFPVNVIRLNRISERTFIEGPVIYLPLGQGRINGNSFQPGDLVTVRTSQVSNFSMTCVSNLLTFIPSFLENLPVEILTHIGSFLSNTDLLSLISSSSKVYFKPPIKEQRQREGGVYGKSIEYWPVFIYQGSSVPECYQYFLERGADIRAEENGALRMAVKNGHLNIVKLLLSSILTAEDGIAVREAIRADNNYAVRRASKKGHPEIVELLMSFGLTIDDVSFQYNYALRKAAENGHLEVVQMLLSFFLTAGEHVQRQAVRDLDNYALRFAAFNGHLEIVKLLLSTGLTIQDIRTHANSVLFYAVQRGHLELVSFLLTTGLTRREVENIRDGLNTTNRLVLENKCKSCALLDEFIRSTP